MSSKYETFTAIASNAWRGMKAYLMQAQTDLNEEFVLLEDGCTALVLPLMIVCLIIAFSPDAKVAVVLFVLSLGTWLVSQLNESS